MASIEWLKSGPDTWTARSNAYTIALEADGYTVRDGSGREVATERTLKIAKTSAQTDQDRNA